MPGQNKNRYLVSLNVPSKFPYRRPPVDFWHLQVHHDEVGTERPRFYQRLASIRRLLHLVTDHTQVEGVHLARVGVVVSDDDEGRIMLRSRLWLRSFVGPNAPPWVARGRREDRNIRA